MSIDTTNPQIALANATILQIVPSLREEHARAAVNAAYVLLEAGARAIIAADGGPLLRELKSYGGEWVALKSETLNPITRKRNTRIIEQLIASERVDIVHAQGPGGASSARAATKEMAVWLITSIPDRPPGRLSPHALYQGALASGDRVIAPSIYAASIMIKRYHIDPERMVVIPRSVDTAIFDPEAVRPERIASLRDAWGVGPNERIILVPGRVAPWNGQHVVPDTARMLVNGGMRGGIFIIAGDYRHHRRYARAIRRRIKLQGLEGIVRLTGHCPDMPAAFAAADVVVVPAIEPPILGRMVAEAQAMGRPVVTSGVGTLPENIVVPPRIAADLRTGWVVRPGDSADLARALSIPLSMDATAYQALAARARQFAEYMFSPQSVAHATRAVYTSLLARDH